MGGFTTNYRVNLIPASIYILLEQVGFFLIPFSLN